ncbi:MAG TPA: hypothetical protein VHV09_22310 [Trebonia sp.]|nr:hypothetical protein [Trebonia sp.]
MIDGLSTPPGKSGLTQLAFEFPAVIRPLLAELPGLPPGFAGAAAVADAPGVVPAGFFMAVFFAAASLAAGEPGITAVASEPGINATPPGAASTAPADCGTTAGPVILP